jgi:hypothetical protein
VQQHGTRCQLKQKGDRLVLQLKQVADVKAMYFVLVDLADATNKASMPTA